MRPEAVLQGEELLVGAHRGLQDLGRQVEEAGVDVAEEGHRPFGEAGVLGEEARGRRRGSRPRAKAAWVASWAILAARSAGSRMTWARASFVAVVVEGGDGEGLGGVEAVAAGGVAGGDAVDLEGDDLGAGLAGQDAEDRVERADPAQRAGAPAHRLRPGEVADRRLDGLGDDLGGGAARAGGDGEEDAGLLVVALLELVAGEAGGAQEAFEGGGGGVGARALALLADRRARRRRGPRRPASGGGAWRRRRRGRRSGRGRRGRR